MNAERIFRSPRKFPEKIKIFMFFREIYRKFRKIIGFPENFPGEMGKSTGKSNTEHN